MPVKPLRWALPVPLIVAALTGARASRADGVAEAGKKKACVQASTEGQSLRDASKLRAARDAFVTCAKDECPAIVRKACAEWLADVDHRIPTVVLRATSARGDDLPGARFSLDGVAQSAALGAAIAVDPGEHVVHSEGDAGESVDEHVVVMEGQKARIVTLRMPSPAAAPSEPAPPASTSPASGGPSPTAATWIFGGIGVAGLAAFAGFAVSARSSFDQQQRTCAPYCAPSDVDSIRRQALVADVSLGVGVVALGVAAYTFFSHREAPAATSRLEVRPRGDGATVLLGGVF
jgi:hypothetical protein